MIGINEGIFLFLKHKDKVEDTNTHHTMMISTSLIMVGFLFRATNMTVQARSNEKLKPLRDSKEWVIMETSILIGEILFLISGIWTTITMVYKWHGDFPYSFQISIFLSGVIYLSIVIISSRSAMKYL